MCKLVTGAQQSMKAAFCLQGFPGDFGERGPPGPDGEPVCHKCTNTHTHQHSNDILAARVSQSAQLLVSGFLLHLE